MPPTRIAQRKRLGVVQSLHFADDWGHDEHITESWIDRRRAQFADDPVVRLFAMRSHVPDPPRSHAVEAQHWYEQPASAAPVDLEEALQELAEAPADAEEDELEAPAETAMANAGRLLKAMYRISPRRFVVYPVSGGRIAIDTRGPNDRIAVVTCDSDGGALCMVTIDGEYRRARYSTTRQLPDGFIREALAALDAKPAP